MAEPLAGELGQTWTDNGASSTVPPSQTLLFSGSWSLEREDGCDLYEPRPPRSVRSQAEQRIEKHKKNFNFYIQPTTPAWNQPPSEQQTDYTPPGREIKHKIAYYAIFFVTGKSRNRGFKMPKNPPKHRK